MWFVKIPEESLWTAQICPGKNSQVKNTCSNGIWQIHFYISDRTFGAGGFSTGILLLVASCVLAVQFPVIFLPTPSLSHLFTCKLTFFWLLLLTQAGTCCRTGLLYSGLTENFEHQMEKHLVIGNERDIGILCIANKSQLIYTRISQVKKSDGFLLTDTK